MRKCRPIEKYATYEAKNFQKVVSKQITNLQKVLGIYVKHVKIHGGKLRGRGKTLPPQFPQKLSPEAEISKKLQKRNLSEKSSFFRVTSL